MTCIIKYEIHRCIHLILNLKRRHSVHDRSVDDAQRNTHGRMGLVATQRNQLDQGHLLRV